MASKKRKEKKEISGKSLQLFAFLHLYCECFIAVHSMLQSLGSTYVKIRDSNHGADYTDCIINSGRSHRDITATAILYFFGAKSNHIWKKKRMELGEDTHRFAFILIRSE